MDRYVEKIEDFDDEELRMIAHALSDKESRMRELAHDENHLNLLAVRQIRLEKEKGRDYAMECGTDKWFAEMMRFYKSEWKNQYLQDARKYRRLSKRFFEEAFEGQGRKNND